MSEIKDFCRTNSFFSLLNVTKKYKEFLWGNEATIAFLLSVLITILFIVLYKDIGDIEFTNTLKNILVMLVPGLIGLLGFLVAGLAMMASIITREAIKKIDQVKKAKSLAGILFSFYFEGFIVGVNVLLMIFSYVLLTFSAAIDMIYLIPLSGFISYCFWFSIIYAISLLGTCINFFFVNVYYSQFIGEKNNEN